MNAKNIIITALTLFSIASTGLNYKFYKLTDTLTIELLKDTMNRSQPIEEMAKKDTQTLTAKEQVGNAGIIESGFRGETR